VLVLGPRKVVLTLNVSPVPVGWEILNFDFFPWHNLWSFLAVLEANLRNSASFLSFLKERLFMWRTNWVISIGKVIIWILFLFLSGVMKNLLSPGIFRDSPCAISLNTKVVFSSYKLHESIKTPVRTPGVSNEPVWSSIFLTKSYYTDFMDDILVMSGIIKDSRSVVFHIRGDGNTTSNWTSLINFLHHGLFTFKVSELFDLVNFVLIWDEARLMRITVSAFCNIGALNSVIMASGLIHGTGFISHFVVIHVFVSVHWFTTMASLILHLAGDKNLRSNIDIRPSCFSGNLDSIRQSRCSGVSPARSTVLWNMLVSNVGKIINSVNIIPEKLFWELDSLQFGFDNVSRSVFRIPLLFARSGSVNVSERRLFIC